MSKCRAEWRLLVMSLKHRSDYTCLIYYMCSQKKCLDEENMHGYKVFFQRTESQLQSKTSLRVEWEGTVICCKDHWGCFHDGYVLQYLHIKNPEEAVWKMWTFLKLHSTTRASFIFDTSSVNVNSLTVYFLYLLDLCMFWQFESHLLVRKTLNHTILRLFVCSSAQVHLFRGFPKQMFP